MKTKNLLTLFIIAALLIPVHELNLRPVSADDDCGYVSTRTRSAGQDWRKTLELPGDDSEIQVRIEGLDDDTDYEVSIGSRDYTGSVDDGEVDRYERSYDDDDDIEVVVSITNGEAEIRIRLVCDAAVAEQQTTTSSANGRLNGSTGQGVVYANEFGIYIYGLNANSEGYLSLYVSAAELAALPAYPSVNLVIRVSPDGLFGIYKLTTGEYQVNIGPDATGKVQVIIFRGLNAENLRLSEYHVPW